MKIRILSILLAALFFGAPGAEAVSSQSGGESGYRPEEIAAFAKKVERTLAAKGARVFIISRVGRPANELPPGIHYTHTAIGVYSAIKTRDGQMVPGYTIYNLYQRAKQPDISDLVTDFPVDFFSGVYALKAGIIIPKPELQKRLLEVIGSEVYGKLHNSNYSAIANPFNSHYQNCTEYTLDVINAAVYQTDDVRRIKANEKAWFEPQPVEVNPVKMLFGSIFMPDIATSDHQGKVKTATFTTIAKYMADYDMMQEQFTVLPD